MPVKKLKIASGFKGSSVSIRRGSRMIRVDLDRATPEQMKLLYDLGHPSIQPDVKAKKE